MATIKKRNWTDPNGVEREAWQVRFVDQDGKQRAKQFRLKKDADAWLVKARGQVDAGTFMAESDSPTVLEAIDAWITRGEAERLERSTIRQRRQHKAHILQPASARRRRGGRRSSGVAVSFAQQLAVDGSGCGGDRFSWTAAMWLTWARPA